MRKCSPSFAVALVLLLGMGALVYAGLSVDSAMSACGRYRTQLGVNKMPPSPSMQRTPESGRGSRTLPVGERYPYGQNNSCGSTFHMFPWMPPAPNDCAHGKYALFDGWSLTA